MKPTFNFFNNFIQSCSHFSFFKNIIHQRLSVSFKFLFMLILIISIVIGVRHGWVMGEFLKDMLGWIETDLPHMSIKDGALSVEADQPFITAYKDVPVLIDTTGEWTSLDEYEEAALVQKDKVIYKDRKTSNEIILKLDRIRDLDLTADFINKMRKNIHAKMIPVAILFLYIYFSIVKLMHVFLFSLAGFLVSNFKNKGFTYKEILNMSVYSFSPVALVAVVFGLLQIHNSVSWVIYTGLYAFYMVGAVFYTTKKDYISPKILHST